MQLVNVKTNRITKCAFCKHWYDPTNSAIVPKQPAAGFWEYDSMAKNKCMIRGVEMAGMQSCGKFESKV